MGRQSYAIPQRHARRSSFRSPMFREIREQAETCQSLPRPRLSLHDPAHGRLSLTRMKVGEARFPAPQADSIRLQRNGLPTMGDLLPTATEKLLEAQLAP